MSNYKNFLKQYGVWKSTRAAEEDEFLLVCSHDQAIWPEFYFSLVELQMRFFMNDNEPKESQDSFMLVMNLKTDAPLFDPSIGLNAIPVIDEPNLITEARDIESTLANTEAFRIPMLYQLEEWRAFRVNMAHEEMRKATYRLAKLGQVSLDQISKLAKMFNRADHENYSAIAN